MNIDFTEVLRRAVRYLVQGFAVALAAYYIPQKKIDLNEIMVIAMTAASIFALLDVLSPTIGGYVKTGIGIGIGLGQVGF